MVRFYSYARFKKERIKVKVSTKDGDIVKYGDARLVTLFYDPWHQEVAFLSSGRWC